MRRTTAFLSIAAFAAALAPFPALAQPAAPTMTVKEIMDTVRRTYGLVIMGFGEHSRVPTVRTQAYLDSRAALAVMQPVCDARIGNFFRTGDPTASDPSIAYERLMAMTVPKTAVSETLISAIAADYIW